MNTILFILILLLVGAALIIAHNFGDVWIDSKEACRALGWKSISTTMLRKAGIRYRQPLGKHRKITAHKGDIENYVRNRRDGRK